MIWFVPTILSLLSLGLSLVYLCIEEGFNVAFFFGASAMFLIFTGWNSSQKSEVMSQEFPAECDTRKATGANYDMLTCL